MPTLTELSLANQLVWIANRRAELQKKRQREQNYLNRRKARGTHTPTDDAYEADAILEDQLIEALDFLAALLQRPGPARRQIIFGPETR